MQDRTVTTPDKSSSSASGGTFATPDEKEVSDIAADDSEDLFWRELFSRATPPTQGDSVHHSDVVLSCDEPAEPLYHTDENHVFVEEQPDYFEVEAPAHIANC